MKTSVIFSNLFLMICRVFITACLRAFLSFCLLVERVFILVKSCVISGFQYAREYKLVARNKHVVQ